MVLKARAKASIVIIDDQETIRTTLRKMLEGEGYRVRTFDNAGEGAIHVWQNRAKVDLILLDLEMEETGATGEEFFKRIRNIPDVDIQRIPIVIVTSVTSREDVMRVVKLNPDGYVIKPFKHEPMVAKVEECLAHSKKKRSQLR